jgi:Bacterial mobilisation protein (MobC)
VDHTDAFRLWTPEQGVPPVYPAQPSPDWMRPSPGGSRMSDKRQRTKIVPVRVSPVEHAAITALADKRGLSPGAIIRQTLLDVPPGPTVRRPSADTKLLAHVLAELGKIGSNINQIAYRYNISDGRPTGNIEAALDAALRELLEWRTALMQALGYDRSRKPHDRD